VEGKTPERGFRRHDRLEIEGDLTLEFAIIEEEDDRISIDGYDLHDLLASQFSDTTNMDRIQKLGKFRVTVERML
jgi:hypothetical protein